MRSTLTIVLIAFLWSCSPSCPNDKSVYKVLETTYYYTAVGVESPVKGKLYKGNVVSVVNTTNNNHWWLICIEGENGFVQKSKLEFIDKDAENLNFLYSIQDSSSFGFFLVYITLFGSLSFLLAFFIGRNRRIGFWFSFVLGILITPFISWVPVALSRKREGNSEISKTNKIIRKVIGVLLILFSVFGILINSNATKDSFITYFLAIGFVSYGIYLLKNSNKGVLIGNI